MKRYLIAIILILSGTAAHAQTKTVHYYYDNSNRMTGYVYEGLFQRSVVYDPTGNVIGRNNEFPSTGASEIPREENDYIVFPNPFGESGFRLTLPAEAKNLDIKMYDLTGKPIPVNYTHGAGQVHVEAGHLAAGLYLCRITYNGSARNIKILKQ